MNENDVKLFGKNCIILSSVILMISTIVSVVLLLKNDIGSILPVIFVMVLLCVTGIWGIVRGYKRIKNPGKYIQQGIQIVKNPLNYKVNTDKNGFNAYKSKWAWDDAAYEYCSFKEYGYEEMPEEENDKVYEYASMPAAYFLMWLIENDYMSESFYVGTPNEEINKLKAHEITPVDFFVNNMDCCLLRDEIAEKILPFVDAYFETVNVRGYLNFRNPEMSDYYKCIENEYHFYFCVDFSWDIYDRIRIKINDALEERVNNNNVRPLGREK